jgi:hypothetical protein
MTALICLGILWIYELDWVIRTKERMAIHKEADEAQYPFSHFYKWFSLWISITSIIFLFTAKYSFWTVLLYMVFASFYYYDVKKDPKRKYSIPEHQYECLTCFAVLTFAFVNEGFLHYHL